MGSTVSKDDSNAAQRLCKERTQYIKKAADSRYALSAAHLAYVQSLRNVGTALRRYTEAEILMDSSLSASEPDKSPSHSSYASPSPSQFPEHVGSPLHNGSPFTPRQSNVSYMRVMGTASVKVTANSPSEHFVEDDSLTFPMPPPPPPLPEIGSSWDFFDPLDAMQASKFTHGENTPSPDFTRSMHSKQFNEDNMVSTMEDGVVSSQTKELKWCKYNTHGNDGNSPQPVLHGNTSNSVADVTHTGICKSGGLKYSSANGSAEPLARIASSELCKSKNEKVELEKELCTKREDSSEFITHRAKDFLSSIKDIEHRFSRAAEFGHEVSRMLETSKIRLGIYSKAIGKSSGSQILSALHLVCCNAEKVPEHDAGQPLMKVITWRRSVSSRSSSSRIPLTSASRDDNCESGSDFIEEFCMISGSHSSTLDRLYAWERKLYDEVKASASIRNAYDQKCAQLRHQFARDLNAHVIDKTRAVVKDLHSQVMVAIHAVDSISKRIERLRDEELQPQLLELIQGLVRMWKAMLECHHAQHITISLAYHARSSTVVPKGEPYRQALIHLQAEMDCFGTSFENWINAYRSYVEALNTWLQKCILHPQERPRGWRFVSSPPRPLAPPIFALCRDWLDGLKSRPPSEVWDSIKDIISVLHESLQQQIEHKQTVKMHVKVEDDVESVVHEDSKEDENNVRDSTLPSLQVNLTRTFDQLAKFAESSLKMYENVKQVTESARTAYENGRFRS